MTTQNLDKPRQKSRVVIKDWWGGFLSWLAVNKAPVQIWLGFRLALLLLPVFIRFLLPFSDTTPLPVGYQPNPNLYLDYLIRGWMRWDGGFYVTIAQQGYHDTTTSAFFPLYPGLLRLVSLLFFLNNTHNEALYLAGMLVSTLATLAAFVGFYKLAALDYDEETSRLAVLYMAAFPVAFFLLAIYTESLFIALAVWTFWAARRNRWWLAGLLMALAVLTKNQGTLLVLALGLEYLYQLGFNPRRLDRRVFSFLLPALTYGGWLAFNQVAFGNPFEFVKVQEIFLRGFRLPWETLWLATQQFFYERSPGSILLPHYDTGSFLYDYPLTLLFLVLLIVGIVTAWRERLRWSYLAFFALALLQPLAQPAQGNWLNGMPRFIMIIFPAYLLLALAGRRWKTFHYTYLALSFPLLGLLLARFVLNYWVA